MNHAKMLANSIIHFSDVFFLFFLSLTKRIRGFNTWIKKIFTADI